MLSRLAICCGIMSLVGFTPAKGQEPDPCAALLQAGIVDVHTGSMEKTGFENYLRSMESKIFKDEEDFNKWNIDSGAKFMVKAIPISGFLNFGKQKNKKSFSGSSLADYMRREVVGTEKWETEERTLNEAALAAWKDCIGTVYGNREGLICFATRGERRDTVRLFYELKPDGVVREAGQKKRHLKIECKGGNEFGARNPDAGVPEKGVLLFTRDDSDALEFTITLTVDTNDGRSRPFSATASAPALDTRIAIDGSSISDGSKNFGPIDSYPGAYGSTAKWESEGVNGVYTFDVEEAGVYEMFVHAATGLSPKDEPEVRPLAVAITGTMGYFAILDAAISNTGGWDEAHAKRLPAKKNLQLPKGQVTMTLSTTPEHDKLRRVEGLITPRATPHIRWFEFVRVRGS